MSGFLNNLHDRRQQFKEHLDERRDALQERRGLGRGRQHHDAGHGHAAFSSQGGLGRGDFASDADIDRMVSSGTFDGRQRDEYGRYDAPSGPPGQGYGRGSDYGRDAPSGRYDAPSGLPPGRRQEYDSGGGYGGPDRQSQDWGSGGRYDTPSGPPPGRRQEYEPGGGGYGGPDRQSQDWSKPPAGQGNAGRYDTPSGPPPGRRQEYESGGGGYDGGLDRQKQDWSQQPQGRTQYDSQASQYGYGKDSGNTPSGGFGASREGEDQYRSGYGGPRNDRDDPSRRGEASSYYNQQGSSGQGDRYSHLAGIAQEHGNDDPEAYRRATQGLQDRIQAQQPGRRNDEDDDYRRHADAHRKAYGDDDHGPMDADAIGAAAAIEAIKQTAGGGGSSNAPAGAFKTGGSSSKPGRAPQAEEAADEEEAAAARAGGSGGMQDKLMALAMSHAGKLFDKKNAGASGGDKTQDKAQAMQSAAATAMQLFAKYQSSGKLESGDMSTVMGLAMKML